MFHTEQPTQETGSNDYYELKRDDLIFAIAAAKSEGFEATEEALIELLSVLDDVLGDGGSIRVRMTKGTISA